ncbi:hypothetical protein N1851_010183 [Merluccius polli]|uniref:Uncharacterized protein n=1 Tax=Merluccius polli TaxID=89951 RepID=A0AA47N058_MERPO|nr:hypothetical protein N1851_010183 [Merluccius polli]
MATKVEVATRAQSDCGVAPCLEDKDHLSTSGRFARSKFSTTSCIENLTRRGSNGGDEEGPGIEPVAIQTQMTGLVGLSYTRHQTAPGLGSPPDGLVFEPTESPPFGLLAMMCPNANSYVHCSHLKMQSDTMKLKNGSTATTGSQSGPFWQRTMMQTKLNSSLIPPHTDSGVDSVKEFVLFHPFG